MTTSKPTNFEFRRLSEIAPAESVTTLIYGSSGSGKTTFGGTAGNRTLIVDNGKGIDALKSPYFTKHYPEYNQQLVVSIRESDDAMFAEKPTGFDEIAQAIDAGFDLYNEQFDTVFIDDSTALRRMAMNKALEVNRDLGKSQSWGQSKTAGFRTVAVQDYGTEMDLIAQYFAYLVTKCKNFKKHLIIAAHIRQTFRKADKIGGQPTLIKVGPAFTGQTFPDDVCALFDNVWLFENVNGGKFRCITKGNDLYTANTSTGGVFNEVEENPDFLKMLSRIQAAKEAVKLPNKR